MQMSSPDTARTNEQSRPKKADTPWSAIVFFVVIRETPSSTKPVTLVGIGSAQALNKKIQSSSIAL